MEKDEIIELRSNEVQEILSRPPRWIVRWGITIILFVILIIIVGSWFFKYPDIITAKIVLTTQNPPSPIVARTSGKIQHLFVTDQSIVSKGQVLAVVENPADFYHVVSIIEKLNQLNIDSLEFYPDKIEFSGYYNLGNIQSVFADFTRNIEDFKQFLSMNYYSKKIKLLQNEIAQYNFYIKNLKVQKELQLKEYKLTFKQFNRDSTLHAQQLMSDAEFEKSRSVLLTKQFNYEQTNISLTSTQIQIQNIEQNIAELELQEEKQLNDKKLLIKQSYENLLATVDTWKYQYLLVASTDGKITFNKYWNENQTITSGERVITIIPANEGEIMGRVQLPFHGAGKVKVGQKVNIRFDNYPYMEYGMVKGEVKSISMAPDNNFYTVEIILPEGLLTFYNVQLDFKQEMQGTAEIITENFRLLERIIRPLRYTIMKNSKL